MKKLILCAIIGMMALAAAAQTVQHGLVLEYREAAPKTALPGVEVRVYPAQSTVSDTNGKFSLEFLTLSPGERISVRSIAKDGYEVFNSDALEQWNLSPENTFSIVMCRSDRFKRLKDLYYANSEERYARQYRDAAANLRRLRDANRIAQHEFADSLARIEKLYARQLENLDNYVDRFARIDLSEISAAEQEIIGLVQAGRIDEAIARYDELGAAGRLVSTLRQRAEVRQAVERLGEAEAGMTLAADSLLAVVSRQIQTLELAGDYGNNARILELYRSVADSDTTNIDWVLTTANYIKDMVGDYAVARGYVQKALDYVLSRPELDELQLASCYHQLGLICSSAGEYSAATSYFTLAQEIWLRLLEPEHPNIATSFNVLGNVYAHMGDNAKAFEYYEKALDLRLRTVGPDDYTLGPFYTNLGLLYHSMEDYVKSEEYHRKALEILIAAHGCNHKDVATAYNNLANAYAGQGDYDKSIEYHLISLDIDLRVIGPGHPDVAKSYINLGYAFILKEDYENATKYLSNALELLLNTVGPNHPDVAAAYDNLGLACYYQENYPQALEAYNKALDIWMRAFGPNYPELEQLYNNMGYVSYNMGNYAKAENFFSKSLGIALETELTDNSGLALIYNHLSKACDAQGKYDVAIEYLNKSIELYAEAQTPENDENVMSTLVFLGSLYQQTGNYSMAKECFGHAISFYEGVDSPDAVTLTNLYVCYLQSLVGLAETFPRARMEIEEFMADKVWIGTVAGEDSPAPAKGLYGDYVVLELSGRSFVDGNEHDLLSAVEALGGQNSSLVLMGGYGIVRYDFSDAAGLDFYILRGTPELKAEIIDAYRQWKDAPAE